MPVKPVTNQRGFTLIEVIIAMAIFAILAAIAVPSFNVWRQNAQFRSDARSVMGALQQARVQAVTRNEPITVDFVGNNGNNSWTAKDGDGSDAGLTSIAGSLSSGFSLNGATGVTFTSRGLLDPMTEVDFTIEGYGVPFTVRISPVGNISLKRE